MIIHTLTQQSSTGIGMKNDFPTIATAANVLCLFKALLDGFRIDLEQ